MKLIRTSQYSGRTHEMEIPLTNEEFEAATLRWESGVLIQDAFPTLSIDQREFLLTGMTPEEWDEYEDDEEEL